ncbi:MAG: hypothetical protein ACLQAT_10250 [Candidatus Binataceae bacterium]
MAEGSPKSTGGFLSGIAAAATAVAAIVAVLSQFGLLGNHDTVKQVVVMITPGTQPSAAANQVVAAAQAAKPSTARLADVPRPHRKPKKTEPAEMAAITPGSPVQPPAVAPVSSAAEAPASSPQIPAASNTLAMIEPAQPPSLAGAWRDMGIGACHLINQSGAKFEVTNYDPSTGEVMSQGQGTINGNHVEIEVTSARHPTSLDFHVSPDGREMYGKVFRVDGPHRVDWNYIGPACARPG